MHPSLSITICDVDREHSAKSLWPGFSLPMETVYRLETMNDQYRIVTITWLITIVLADTFILSDYLIDIPDIKTYLIGRFAVLTPLSLLAVYFIAKRTPFYQLAVLAIPLIITAVLSAMLVMSKGSYRSIYLFGNILAMMGGVVIGRPRLSYAVVSVGLQSLCYDAVLVLSDVIPPEGIVVSILFCATGGVIAIMTAYMLEHISRRAFLLSIRVRLMNRDLEALAMTDQLTGLGNRRAFHDATQRFWGHLRSEEKRVSLILIDVDRFKAFNDNYGHSAGDLCLKTIGRCLAGVKRSQRDMAVRFGGEEFVIFLPDTDFQEAQGIAEAMRVVICAAAIPHPVIGENAVVTASLGVATASIAEATPAELVVRADVALYAAKNNGRNRIWPPLGSDATDPAWQTPSIAKVA